MSILKKIKEKILNLSNSYSFYKNYYYQNENLQDISQKLESIEEKLDSNYINHNKVLNEDYQKLAGIGEKLDSNYIHFNQLLKHNSLELNNNLNNKFDEVKINQNVKYYNLINFFENTISSLEKNYLDHMEEFMFNLEEIFENANDNNEQLYNEILKECSDITSNIKRDNRVFYDMMGNDFEILKVNQDSFERAVSDKIDDLSDSVLSINKSSKDNANDFSSKLNNLEKNLKADQNSLERVVSEKIDGLYDSILTIGEYSRDNAIDLLTILENLEKTLKNPMNNVDLKNAIMTINEVKYGLIYKDTIINSKWFKDTNLSLNNSAANYSFIYLLYRVLNEIKPKNILEFGLGQTTRLTIQYANYFKDTTLQVIEDNQNWIDTFLENYNVNNNVSIAQCDLEEFEYNNSKNLRYKNLDNIIKNKKFDLIIIDGPRGWLQMSPLTFQEYPRSNIWDLISKNLKEDFVIILDDYDRIGEQNTSKITLDLLSDHNKQVYSQEFNGLKNQLLLCSEKNRFSTWY